MVNANRGPGIIVPLRPTKKAEENQGEGIEDHSNTSSILLRIKDMDKLVYSVGLGLSTISLLDDCLDNYLIPTVFVVSIFLLG